MVEFIVFIRLWNLSVLRFRRDGSYGIEKMAKKRYGHMPVDY